MEHPEWRFLKDTQVEPSGTLSGKLTIEHLVELARWSMGNKVCCYADLHKKQR